jgi:hypothetical protein
MGGVVDTVSNLVGDAVDFVASNPVVLAPLLGPEMLAADAAGGSFLGDAFAGDALGSVIGDAGVGGSFLGDTTGAGSAIGDIAFDGPTITSGGGYNPPIDSFDGPTITSGGGYNPPIDSFDGPTITSGGGYNPPIDSFDGPTLPDKPFDGPTLPSTPTGGIVDAVKGLIGQLTPSSTTLSNVFSNFAKAAPIAGAGILGKLAYSDQANINKSITDAYNAHLLGQAGIKGGYGVTTGPQQLNYMLKGVPLAQAQPRTIADVVSKPKAAKGGSINDLYNEYSQLNNRMRNYRKFAKGGLI